MSAEVTIQVSDEVAAVFADCHYEPLDLCNLGAGLKVLGMVADALRPWVVGDRFERGALLYEIAYIEGQQYVCRVIREHPDPGVPLQVLWDDQLREAKRRV